MITEDTLRSLLAGEELPPSVSPAQVRRRAHRLRRNRRVGVLGGVALALPGLLIGLSHLSPFQGRSAGAGLPVAFGGDGTALPLQADGKVALNIPHLFAYTGPGDLCWGSDAAHGVGGMCMVDHADDVSNGGISVGNGVIGSISVVPVVRADFVVDSKVIPAQVVGFARYPQWRTLTAPIDPADELADKVLIQGWDAAGRQVLGVCVGAGCPQLPQPTSPALPPDPANQPAPAAKSAVPIGGPLAVLPDLRVAVLPGADAWPTAHGVCVGNDNSSQCVTDGDTHIDDGFAIGAGVASTIVGKPVVRAEFIVNGLAVPAGVVEFASHPQWRVIIADVKLSTWAGSHVTLRGWDAAGQLIINSDPPATR